MVVVKKLSELYTCSSKFSYKVPRLGETQSLNLERTDNNLIFFLTDVHNPTKYYQQKCKCEYHVPVIDHSE